MQTFKTAVIVVLIGTVVWGVCVSLTTPPAELPDDIIMAINETDTEFPQGSHSTLESLGIDAGLPELPDTFGADLGMPDGDLQGADGGGVVGSLSDSHQPPPPASTPLATRLPKPTPGATPPTIDVAHSYESTGQDHFQLPDPSSLSAPMPSYSQAATGPAADPLALPDPTDLAPPADGGGFQFPQPDAKPLPADTAAADPAGAQPTGAQPTATAPASPAIANVGLANAILAADQHVEADRMKEALATLSVFYGSPDLTASEREQLTSRLDPLAGEVIYSRLHLLEQPYRVGQNETLMEIAAKYEVPWQLLANINGIEDPVVVLPGTELKVVRGPFRAEIDLKKTEMTLMLGELYAGRFPITLGKNPAPQPGTYTVKDKQTAKAFYDASGASIPPGDPRNPFGSVWLDLGQQMCIHGSAAAAEAMGKGCISLQTADAEDVYGILSQGSTISIRR